MENQPVYFRTAQILKSDMSEELENDAINITTTAFAKYRENLIQSKADYIKENFGRMHGAGWSVVNSKAMGFSVSYNQGEFIKLEIEDQQVIIFRRGEYELTYSK